MSTITGYIVNSGHIKVGGKWYKKGEVISGLAKPIARELVKAGRIIALEEVLDPDPPEVLDPEKPKQPKSPKK